MAIIKYVADAIPTEQIVDDYLRGLTITDIHKKYGISKKVIKNRLKIFIKILNTTNPEELQHYKENKANIIDAVQLKIINEMMNEYKIKRAPLRDLAGAFEKLYNANRLERNQSTQNISMKQESFVSMVQDIIKDKNIEQL